MNEVVNEQLRVRCTSAPVAIHAETYSSDHHVGDPRWEPPITAKVTAVYQLHVDDDAVTAEGEDVVTANHKLHLSWHEDADPSEALVPLDRRMILAIRAALNAAEVDIEVRGLDTPRPDLRPLVDLDRLRELQQPDGTDGTDAADGAGAPGAGQ